MKAKTIGVLAPLLDGFYFNGILQGIHQTIKAQNANLILFQTMDAMMTKVTYQRFLAADHIDGWIVLLNAVTDSQYIQELEMIGKPIICSPFKGAFTSSSTFVIDNEQGGYDSVSHLIQHGHLDIACVFSSRNPECILRYEGYVKALKEHNIPFRRELVYDMSDLWEDDGIQAAHFMKQRNFGFSAIAAFSDMLAIGIMDTLQAWNIRIPEDIAIIGFDNLEAACQKSLSTIEQPLFNRGCHMADILLRQMNDHALTSVKLYKEPTILILRESCGCHPVDLSIPSIESPSINPQESIEYLSKVIQRNHHIAHEMVKTDGNKIKDLSWLQFTDYTWACLALWCEDECLAIDSIYSTKRSSPIMTGQKFAERSFPPTSVHSIMEPDEALSIHTIRTDDREWGYILLIGKINDKNRTSNYQNDTLTHSLDFVAYTLERDAIYEDAVDRETRLEIVTSTTNDGIFDWDLITKKMSWNQKIRRILGDTDTNMNEREFFRRLHPDDLFDLYWTLQQHFEEGVPFQTEFRIQQNDNRYTWVSAAGEAIRDAEGIPVRMIGSIVDITERKKSEERIRHIAYHDTLTELPNRRHIYDRISEQCRRKDQFAVMLLDLDRFKNINDSLGHSIGDRLLQEMARLLQEKTGPNDIVARLGGDEFIILSRNLKEQETALALADTIVTSMNTQFEIEGHFVFVTASIGISFYPEHGIDQETLVKNADLAMYHAKENGKNQVQSYNERMSTVSLERLTLETHLRGALDNGEFQLYYQPQYDTASNKIVGMEALIRWFSPEFGMVPPLKFIPLAEETGLILPISEWVLKQACQDNKLLIDGGYEPLIVSVNISADHFTDMNFVQKVECILGETGLPPNQLCLEITESVAILNLELTIRHLNNLIALGVYIALDDFGTGNSSLSLVKSLPLHVIKIDRAFVNDMTQSDTNMAILDTILSLTRGLKLESCAEGVETAEQFEIIRDKRCSLVQGYFFSKPVPLMDLAAFLTEMGSGPCDYIE